MRLIFHGKLRELFGESAFMNAESVAEAVEGYSRQQPLWPREMRISIAGFDTPEKLEHWAEEVHILPTFHGGGGKFGSIILGAALIGLAVATGGATSGFFLAAHASLLLTGGLMVLQGVMSLFMKAPKVTSSSDPDASKYLGINKNTTEAGTPIPLAWGTIDLQPHWLSLQSDSTNISYGAFPATPS